MAWIWIGTGSVAGIVLIVAVMASKVKCRIDARSSGLVQTELVIDVKALFGLVSYRYHLDGIHFKGWLEGVELHSAEAGRDAAEDPWTGKAAAGERSLASGGSKRRSDPFVTLKDARQAVLRGIDMLRHIAGLRHWLIGTASRIRCTSLVWHTQLGVYDAAQTAILSGILWIVKSLAAGMLFRRIRLAAQPDLRVTPLYNVEYFALEARVQFEARTYVLVAAVVRLGARMLRGRGDWRYWMRQFRSLRARRKRGSKLPAT